MNVHRARSVLLCGAVAVCLILGLLRFGDVGVAAGFEASLTDNWFRLASRPASPAPVTMVVIDDASVEEIGRWPWSREVDARLLERIAAANPRVVVFDLLLTDKQDGADQVLAGAIARHGPVILPFAIELGHAAALERPDTPPWIRRAAYPRVLGTADDHLPVSTGLRIPDAVIGPEANVAHVTVAPDSIGSVRRDYPLLKWDGAYYPSLALEAARLFWGIARTDVVVEPGRGIRLGPHTIPLDDGMRMPVDFQPPGSFVTVSARDVLNGDVPRERFAGRVVLVGVSAVGIADVAPSPFTPALLGLERQATLVAELLDNRVLRDDDSTRLIAAAAMLACALMVGWAACYGTAATAFTAAVLMVALPVLDFTAFAALGLVVNLLFPIATVLAALAIGLGSRTLAARETVTKLRFQAERDALTGLLNRAGLAEWLLAYRRQVGRRGGGLLILLGDLDGFKAVNDTLGHPAGDQLLRQVGQRLQHAVRPGDVVARLGGDEFVIAVTRQADATEADAMLFAKRVLDRLTEPYDLDAGPVRVGLSLGASRWPQDGAQIDQVMALADQALYAAKRAGKGRVGFSGAGTVPASVATAS